LRADHAEVKKLFAQYEKLAKTQAPSAERGQCAGEICDKLTVHATIEEEIFYPAAREALGAGHDEVVAETDVEHASAKELIAHHVKAEQSQMYLKLSKKLDMVGLGEQLQARRSEWMANLAIH
jgi:hypothetical protein